MKKSLLFLTACTAFVIACNSNNTDNQNDDTSYQHTDSSNIATADTTLTPIVPIQKKVTACYVYTKNRDTATLQLNTQSEELTGELSYQLFEKDKNTGTIAGEIKGDTIIAEYTFDAEGLRSVREVVFLKKDKKLYEGFGDVEEKKGKIVFKDRSKLKFDDTIVFSQTDCP